MSFAFRLKSVLVVRQRERGQRRSELAEAVRAEALLGERRRRLELQRSDTGSPVAQTGGELNLSHLQAADQFRRVLRRELKSLTDELQRAQAEVDERRQAVVAADQQVRALEKLHERQRAEFDRQHATRRQRELDEAASRISGANNATGPASGH